MKPTNPVIDKKNQIAVSDAPAAPQNLSQAAENKGSAVPTKAFKDVYENVSPHEVRSRKEVEADARKLGDAFVKQLRSSMAGWEPAKKEEWFTKEQLDGLKKMRDSI